MPDSFLTVCSTESHLSDAAIYKFARDSTVPFFWYFNIYLSMFALFTNILSIDSDFHCLHIAILLYSEYLFCIKIASNTKQIAINLSYNVSGQLFQACAAYFSNIFWFRGPLDRIYNLLLLYSHFPVFVYVCVVVFLQFLGVAMSDS